MLLTPPLIPATLIKRYKRFLADVTLSSGETITVHTPNTGSMLGLSEPGMSVWLRDTQNPKRKYRYSWEMCEPTPKNYVGVHTGIVNQLVTEAIKEDCIPELPADAAIQQEVRYGQEQSRIDLLLQQTDGVACYIEIKNVTAKADEDTAIFPDAVTTCGQKHLRELMHVVESGARAVIFFCVQRNDVNQFRAAHEIDPDYAALLKRAVEQGVEVLAYKTLISPSEISLVTPLPVRLS